MAKGEVKKVPVVMQMEATECGAACLCMILAYYGRWEPLEKVRTACGVSRDGSKASNIIKAGRAYGLDSHGYTFSLEGLMEKDSYPCILFWNFNHFVVLKGFRGKYAYINDPARGAVKVTMDEFDSSFTGIALTFEPTEEFEKGGKPVSTWEFIKERLKGMEAPIIFVAIATALASVTSIISTSLSTVFMDHVLSGNSPSWLIPLLSIMSAIVIGQCAVSVASAIYLNRIRGKLAVVSSSRFMWHLLHLPVNFYAQRSVGDLQQRQESNESVASTLIEELAPTLLNGVLLILYLGIMLSYSWKLTLVGVVTVVLNSVAAYFTSQQRVNITRQQSRDSGSFYSTTLAGIECIETIKACGAEDAYFERWSGYQALVNDSQVRLSKTNVYLGAIPSLLSQLCNIAVLIMGTFLIMNGEFTIGMLLAFQGFLSSFMGPVDSLISLGQQIQEMRTSMERIQDVMNYPADVSEDDKDEEEPVYEKLSGKVEVKNLSFGYSPLEPALIEDLSFTIEPGSWLALVGSSGSGKSTVAKLVSGLYNPWDGEIYFDDVPIKEMPRATLRASLSVVDQDIVTFEDTITDNVRLWDRSIAPFDVILAANDASVHQDIMEREGGYYETISPGGRNFSGGQLQRLEIACALAGDPTIVILDEATSALDAKAEGNVIKAIRERGISCIVVAHRLSTIRDCDEIIVLADGKVQERGTHDELLANDGAYAERCAVRKAGRGANDVAPSHTHTKELTS